MKLKDIIEEYISGDWGNEDFSPDTPCAVYCVRGADIVPISNDQFNDIPLRYISTRAKDNKTMKAGDLVIEKSGGSPIQSTGRIAYISQELIDSKGPLVCSNFCISIRIKDTWNPKFVYYFWQYIYNTGVFFNFEGKTSGLKNLQFDNAIASIDIPEYTLAQQSKIADILSKLEYKMTVNREINRNLEAMARQLYDYWFVQFDFPDENGRPYKSSGGKMVWNEKLKREIPQGWNVDNILSICEIKVGGTPSKSNNTYWDNGSIPFFGPTDVSDNIFQLDTIDHITHEGLEHCASSLFQVGDVILTARGSIGKMVIVGEPMAMNQSCYALSPKFQNTTYLYFLSKELIEWLKAKGSGSVFKSFNAQDVEYSQLCIAPSEIIKKFCKSVDCIFSQIRTNTQEIASLTTQRDELLPLLMNGQVSIMPPEVNCDLSHD